MRRKPPPPPKPRPRWPALKWEHIQRVLTDCEGNILLTARKLGLHRRSLQRKLGKFPHWNNFRAKKQVWASYSRQLLHERLCAYATSTTVHFLHMLHSAFRNGIFTLSRDGQSISAPVKTLPEFKVDDSIDNVVTLLQKADSSLKIIFVREPGATPNQPYVDFEFKECRGLGCAAGIIKTVSGCWP